MQQQTVTKFEQLSRSCALVWNHTPDYMHKIVEYLNCQHWKTFWSAESDVLLQFFQLILLLMWRPFPGMPDFYLRSLTCAKFHCLWTVPKAAAKPLAGGNRCNSDRLWHPLPLLNKLNPRKSIKYTHWLAYVGLFVVETHFATWFINIHHGICVCVHIAWMTAIGNASDLLQRELSTLRS